MEYRQFVEDVEELDFIKDEKTAEAAVKTVLGILASSLEEDPAKLLTEYLPEPLTYDKLRGRQSTPNDISMDELIAEIESRFKLSEEQALELVATVFRDTKEALGEEVLNELELEMPPDVAEEFDNA